MRMLEASSWDRTSGHLTDVKQMFHTDDPQTDVTGQTSWVLSPTISTRTELSSLTPAASLLGASLPGAWRRHPETQGHVTHCWVQQNDRTHLGEGKKENSFMDSVCECFQTSVNGSKHLYSNKATFPVSCCLVNITRDDCHRRLLWNCTTRRQEMEKFTSKHSTKMTLPEVERGPNKVPSQLLTAGRLSLSMRLSPDSSKFPWE